MEPVDQEVMGKNSVVENPAGSDTEQIAAKSGNDAIHQVGLLGLQHQQVDHHPVAISIAALDSRAIPSPRSHATG